MYQCYLSIGIRHYRLHASELKKIFKTEPDNVISLGDVQKNIKGNIIRASMPYSNLNYIVYKLFINGKIWKLKRHSKEDYLI